MKGGALAQFLPVAAAVLLLGGAAADRLSLPRPEDSVPYHAHVRQVAASLPLTMDGWTSQPVAVPTEAISCLKPNVLISQQYSNPSSHEQFQLLLIQCADVRDLAPHYPPMCYPGRGLDLTGSVLRTWKSGDESFLATEYQFCSNSFSHNDPLVVENFMILPTGCCVPEMGQVRKQIGLSSRYFGAAEVQVVFAADVPEARRLELTAACVKTYLPLIDAIKDGVAQNYKTKVRHES